MPLPTPQRQRRPHGSGASDGRFCSQMRRDLVLYMSQTLAKPTTTGIARGVALVTGTAMHRKTVRRVLADQKKYRTVNVKDILEKKGKGARLWICRSPMSIARESARTRLRHLVRGNPLAFQREMLERLAHSGFKYSGRTSIQRILRSLGISRKKLQRLSINKDFREQIRELRWIQQADPQDILVLDESHRGADAERRRYGYTDIGHPARIYGSTRWYRNSTAPTLIGVADINGFIQDASEVVQGTTVDADRFQTFAEDILCPYLLARFLRTGKQAVLIADNCSIHEAAGLHDLVSACGAELRYLPPYSPELSPIELMFAKVKSELRDLPDIELNDVELSTRRAMASVRPGMAKRCFAHCGYSIEEEGTGAGPRAAAAVAAMVAAHVART